MWWKRIGLVLALALVLPIAHCEVLGKKAGSRPELHWYRSLWLPYRYMDMRLDLSIKGTPVSLHAVVECHPRQVGAEGEFRLLTRFERVPFAFGKRLPDGSGVYVFPPRCPFPHEVDVGEGVIRSGFLPLLMTVDDVSRGDRASLYISLPFLRQPDSPVTVQAFAISLVDRSRFLRWRSEDRLDEASLAWDGLHDRRQNEPGVSGTPGPRLTVLTGWTCWGVNRISESDWRDVPELATWIDAQEASSATLEIPAALLAKLIERIRSAGREHLSNLLIQQYFAYAGVSASTRRLDDRIRLSRIARSSFFPAEEETDRLVLHPEEGPFLRCVPLPESGGEAQLRMRGNRILRIMLRDRQVAEGRFPGSTVGLFDRATREIWWPGIARVFRWGPD